MGKAKKTRKFAEVKRLLHPKDLKPCVFVILCDISHRNHTSTFNIMYCAGKMEERRKKKPKSSMCTFLSHIVCHYIYTHHTYISFSNTMYPILLT